MSATISTLLEGEQAIVTLVYVDTAGDPTDPTAITAVVQDPDDGQESYDEDGPELASSVTGTWVLTVPVSTVTGRWVCNVTATSGGRSEVVEVAWHMNPTAIV